MKSRSFELRVTLSAATSWSEGVMWNEGCAMREVSAGRGGVQLMVGWMACVCILASLGCVLEEGGSEEDAVSRVDDVFNSESEPQEGRAPEPEPIEEPVQRGFDVSGQVDGASRDGHAMVLWYVTSGDGPYFYYHGGGEVASDGAWSVRVPLEGGELPDEAVNEDGVATAMVLGVTSWQRAELDMWGRVSWEEFREIEGRTFAVSKASALVLVRQGATPDERHVWAEEFVSGEVTCGVALSSNMGAEPAPCSSFALEATRDLAWIRF